MKLNNIIIILFNLWMVTTQAQSPVIGLMHVRVDVVYLASDLLEGRGTGTKGEQLSAEYIQYRFKQLGLAPAGLSGSWKFPFTFKEKAHPHDTSQLNEKNAITGYNVLGKIDNGSPYTVIIGAHYDHLGLGGAGSGSLSSEQAIHNGADDNASGVAGMLAIAERLKNNTNSKSNNYLFIAFSGEEKGLFGSNAYTKDAAFDAASINYMINLDMIGRLSPDRIIAISGVGTSPAWKPLLENNAIVKGIKISATESGQGPSDHTSFYLKDIPVLHLFTGQHKDYHKPTDDAPLVNFEGILEVADLVVHIIEDKNNQGKITFQKTKDESGKRAMTFKVTMGVMPDYLYQEGGLRLDGVTEGKPAAVAGLRAGDIILKIGSKEIKDMNSYMEALGMHNKGDKVKVTYTRSGKQEEIEVVF